MPTQYTDNLVDIIAEGMLPRSFVELYSVKQAYPHIAPISGKNKTYPHCHASLIRAL